MIVAATGTWLLDTASNIALAKQQNRSPYQFEIRVFSVCHFVS